MCAKQRNNILTILFIFLFTAVSFAQVKRAVASPAMRSAATQFEILSRSIAPLRAGEVTICTAVSISPTRWLTAEHCISRGKANNLDGFPFRVIREDKKADLVLLLVEGKLAPGVPLASKAPRQGDEFYGIGYALRQRFTTIFTGLISQPKATIHAPEAQGDPPDPDSMILYGPATGGHSGSPVVNTAGELLGIVTWTGDAAGGAQMYTLATSIDKIRQFLKK